MDKIIKGKKYIICGNFGDCDAVAEKISKELGVECLAFLSNTDNVSFIPYEEEDEELIKLGTQNDLLKREVSKLKSKLYWFQK
jgi:hypothetical protein